MKKKIILYLISLVVLVQLVLAFQCNDGIDNDGDGLNDTLDSGCYDTGSYDPSDDDELDTLPVCSNFFDDDNDGVKDSNDAGCYDTGSYDSNDDSEENTLPVCSNFFDDDNDGSIDASDWGCYREDGTYNPDDSNEANPACSDNADNDGDGKIDNQDYGCYTESGTYKPYDNDETNPQCSDGVDNDGDCVKDFPADPGCNSVYDNSESPNPIGSLVICSEQFAPLIWLCDSRSVTDDSIEQGRNGANLDERVNNYAFEGEQIAWNILVMDKNGKEKIEDVYVTVGTSQGIGNDIEVNCQSGGTVSNPFTECGARIGEEKLEKFEPETMVAYTCTFTVETPDSMYGEYFLTAEVTDLDGLSNTMDENEYWFLNPNIALNVDGALDFGVVRPGTIAYSNSLRVENDADVGSGVLLDMFISGTDLFDPTSSGAMCPTSNRIKLGNQGFGGANGQASTGSLDGDKCDIDAGLTADNADHLCYFAANGAYSTRNDVRKDDEGYVPIHYGTTFTTNFYNDAEIIATSSYATLNSVQYYAGNILSPGADIVITFKLGLPVPCNGDFSDGNLYFWGEAI